MSKHLSRLVFSPKQQQEDSIHLTTEQQHYLKRVLRLGESDRFIAMDGQGKSWLAEIMGVKAQLIDSIELETELPVDISLITALPKGNGYEQIIRSGTELGVSCFIPVLSDRTILKPSNNKVERWRKITTEAAEQSERQIVPQIINPVAFSNAIENLIPAKGDRFICVARTGTIPFINCLQSLTQKNIVIATGTEGGWTKEEIALAISHNFQPVSLGQRILTAVTAPITALSLAAAILEESPM
ncbi:RNA methyltransferase, RsmE family [Xenococcus sp. PCC 7305]|uniref:16S rRNA (uracil(1498)-N(3))-methyltransferase n=1 Tax=Xenococcus sp. PCC 7305 TaxID=102125 RepID=UPI0002AD0B0F|nr:16S rRNA (uracil(1498)-N(3))-methyltransferase [Xenococcus sp. PCC 7305]ELS03103.1 RNA methyltransferase, RsmE family [Xenococcus sp. PCC 7305]